MKRKPSASRVATGLGRLADEAADKIASLRLLGLDDDAEYVGMAVKYLSEAARTARHTAAANPTWRQKKEMNRAKNSASHK